MTPLPEQESGWIAAVAARMLEVRSKVAAGSAEQRLDVLREELDRILEGVPAGERKARLNVLLERFPLAGQVACASPGTAAPEPAAGLEPVSAAELTDRLATLAGELSEDERMALGSRLAAAGLGGVDRGSLVMEVGENLARALHLPEGLQPRLTSVVQLLVLLAGMFQRIDQITMKALIELRPRGIPAALAGDFRRGVAKYLSGKGELPVAQVEATERSLAALVAAVLGCGKDFGRELADRLSPMAIRSVVQAEGGGSSLFGKSTAEKCWEKYCELARDYARAELVDRKLKDVMAAFIDKTLSVDPGGGG
jgi:hypothetical protein